MDNPCMLNIPVLTASRANHPDLNNMQNRTEIGNLSFMAGCNGYDKYAAGSQACFPGIRGIPGVSVFAFILTFGRTQKKLDRLAKG